MYFRILIIVFIFFNFSYAKEFKPVNFRNLELKNFVKIVSSLLETNILISTNINHKIDFISNKRLSKDELFELFTTVLNKNNLTLTKNNGFYVIDNKVNSLKKEIKTITIKNIEASQIVEILKSLSLGKDITISQNKETNSIILLASKEEIELLEEFILSMDKQKIQVYIQAKIIEVNNEKINKIGFSYGIFSSQTNSNDIIAFSSNLNGGSTAFNDVNSVLGLNIPSLSSSLALGASLNLLRQNGALNIISKPSILALNNKESEIYVGQTISIKTSFSLSDGGTSNENYKRQDVGLSLKVKPRISSFDKLTLDINAILEGIKTTQTQSGNADTSKKMINTSVILNNGESVIIGGLTEEKNETTINKIPILGDIPIMGSLFQNQSKNSIKNDLLIVVTPYIIPKSKDITFINEQLARLKMLENRFLKESLEKLEKRN